MPTISISIDVPNLTQATHFYEAAMGCTKQRDQGANMTVLSAGNSDIYLLEKGDGAIAHCADPFGNGFCLIKE